jgi:uncharacterized Zn finger protein
MSRYYYGFAPYVSIAQRQRNAQRELAKLAKKGMTVRPIERIVGRTIAHSFWGQAWCENLESYMDYANRLPRGRTYVRNGSVVHLEVQPGSIQAMVCGSELYKVAIQIVPAAKAKWQALCRSCAGGIGSLVELLQGRLSDHVMNIITGKGTGLFPSPAEIKMKCSCPDSASLCKHLAAVLYGVGARLDQSPDLLFLLRSVNHEELIQHATAATDLTAKAAATGLELSESDIGSVFGIELDDQAVAVIPAPAPKTIAPVVSKDSKGSKARKPARPARSLPATRIAPSKTRISPQGRARIAAAQRARWAEQKRVKLEERG